MDTTSENDDSWRWLVWVLSSNGQRFNGCWICQRVSVHFFTFVYCFVPWVVLLVWLVRTNNKEPDKDNPTAIPSAQPTRNPTANPSRTPSTKPTANPTKTPVTSNPSSCLFLFSRKSNDLKEELFFLFWLALTHGQVSYCCSFPDSTAIINPNGFSNKNTNCMSVDCSCDVFLSLFATQSNVHCRWQHVRHSWIVLPKRLVKRARRRLYLGQV